MRHLFLSCVPAVLAAVLSVAQAETITVSGEKAVVVLPPATDTAGAAAALELKKHLTLITGAEIRAVEKGAVPEGAFCFHIGVAAPGDQKPMAAEEARWKITPSAAWLYGAEKSRGVQFAVCAFLEESLGVRWLFPGDRGIAFTVQPTLKLTIGEWAWIPELTMRNIRPDARPGQYAQKKEYVADFWEFARTPEESDRYAHDVRAWQVRMRMGSHSEVNYGHNFTTWWKQYGKAHPEYFAMKENGKREPDQVENSKFFHTADNPKGFQNIKLCPSSAAVAQQIVQNWVAGGKRAKWVNVCENDSPPVNFCTCPECRKLDVLNPGEKPYEHLTDRYVYLANAVAREVRKINPEAGAVMYAYNETEQPPRREKVEPNVFVAVVPTTADLAKVEALFGGWQNAGAKQMLIRPNLLLYYASTSFPMGFEKHMCDVFLTAWKHGCVGADYDSLTGNWPVNGLCFYTLAKTLSDPTKPYEYWEDQYCAAFGPAAGDVKGYFGYWRTDLWEKRFLPDMDKIITRGRYFNFARGVMWSLGDYYTPADFDRAEAFLQAALAKDLSPVQKEMVNQLLLADQHARLTYRAVVAKNTGKFENAQALLAFRRQHRDDLALNWLGIFATESRFGDVAGLRTATRLAAYPLPWIPTALPWNFKIDPKNVGLQEKWQELPRAETKKWEMLRVDAAWENPYDGENFPSAELRAQLKDYDGIGWYATSQKIPLALKGREVYLYFGGVDESCWVYVNGKPAGQRIFEKSDDWNTPFEIRIDPFIDWQQPEVAFTVRVEDKGGAGGIWRPVWIVSRMPKTP